MVTFGDQLDAYKVMHHSIQTNKPLHLVLCSSWAQDAAIDILKQALVIILLIYRSVVEGARSLCG